MAMNEYCQQCRTRKTHDCGGWRGDAEPPCFEPTMNPFDVRDVEDDEAQPAADHSADGPVAGRAPFPRSAAIDTRRAARPRPHGEQDAGEVPPGLAPSALSGGRRTLLVVVDAIHMTIV